MNSKLGLACAALLASASAAHAWQPTKTIEIVVPFSAGGASDQMARTIQGIIQKNGLVAQPIVIINKPAAAGGEAMLDIKAAAGDAHKLITTSSGIFMTPMTTRLPVTWKDFTPVAMLAQDAFGLWVNGASSYRTAGDFIAAAAKSTTSPFKVGGTGAKREDQLLTFAVEKTTGIKLLYIPHQGGGAASVQLAGRHLEATTNNPAEEFANWRSGSTRPLCVFSEERLPYAEPVAGGQSWADVPTCREQGLDVTYQMLRGMFMPGKVTAEQQAFYVDLFKRVSETAEWKDYLSRNALVSDFRIGEPFLAFLKADEKKHESLLSEAGFLVSQ